MFDEALRHLLTQLSIHSVLSVLDFYVSHVHLMYTTEHNNLPYYRT